jgi:hypothetical protein
MEPAFHTRGDVIRIVNGRGRSATVGMCVIGAVIALLPLLPPETRGTDTDPALYYLGAALCASAAFWWSVVTIDLAAGELTIARRWGAFRSVHRRSLAAFGAVVLTNPSDGAEVHLRQKDGRPGWEANHSHTLVWGRSFEETRAIAAAVAARLALPLEEPPVDRRPVGG